MNRESLEQEANRVIASAKMYLELQQEFPPMFLLHHAAKWRKLPFPDEALAVLNDGKAKDVLFGVIREAVAKLHCDAAMFATDMWRGEVTEEGKKHYNTPEWNQLHSHGFPELVKKGWVKRAEVINVTAQMAADVLIIAQEYQRLGSGLIQLLDCKRYWIPQANFSGRQKMFGDLREENLGAQGWPDVGGVE